LLKFDSKRAGPPLVGYNRFRDLPITIDRIPRVDAVVISHNHFDHLDSDSVVELNKKFGEKDLNWFVGAGVGKFLKSQKITKNVHELEWWDIASHSKSNFNHLKFIFAPAQHWSGRSLSDRFEVKYFKIYPSTSSAEPFLGAV
jgi:N-acyl-phosphatidylethanolamine-hydrolysing phospholipase D